MFEVQHVYLRNKLQSNPYPKYVKLGYGSDLSQLKFSLDPKYVQDLCSLRTFKKNIY